MRLDNFLCDGKSESGSFFVLAAREVRLVKTVPNEFNAVSGDTDTAVLYGNEKLIGAFNGFDFDGRVFVAEFDCVVHEIVKHLLDFYHIGIDKHLITGKHKFNCNEFITAGSSKRGCRIFYNLIDVEIGTVQNHSFCVQVIKRE